ncbi:MAG: DNA repair protein RecN [Moraxellaceae bacterium]|nr:DNA repair protein RecN [Moraxellaceae bacterium]MDP1775135.1 DNA repair protein RecN [Moraxellaceae bacterium]
MLSLLKISQFAIVDNLELEFASGFSVITGETGAGKSILMDALGLCLGDRADGSVVRAGADRADVSALFQVGHLEEAMNWLRERELDESDECTLRRTFSRDGRSRAYINGRPATLTDLRQIGECLIDIHSQHEHQMLLRKDNHRLMLDSFADTQALAKQTASQWRDWQAAAERLAHAEKAGAAQSARLEIVQHLCDELAQLALAEGEYETLVQRHDTLANVGSLQEDGQLALNLLSEADGDTAARLLQRALKTLDGHLSLSPALQEAHNLLNSASIQIDEAIPVLRHFLADLEASPLELEQLATRLGQCHQLARKHRVMPEQLPTVFTELTAEIEQLRQAQDLDLLNQQATQHYNAYYQLAQELRQQRQLAAERFCADIQQFLQGLGLGNARLVLSFTEPAKPGSNGLDDIEFLFSANPGQPLRPLAKVASGGELSRLSLAIQVVHARHSPVPVMVFDEVDVGIGGGIAEVVGRLLRDLGEHAQVFSITHQPQVAARGHHHLRVEKRVIDGETHSTVVTLNHDQRIDEIARMSGGLAITPETRQHAASMLAG